MTLRQVYDNDGFLTGINAVPPNKVTAYTQKCSNFLEQYGNHPSYSQWTYSKTEILLRWVAELAAEKALLDVIEELIGPNILLWNAFLPIKPPHSPAKFEWHQDATY